MPSKKPYILPYILPPVSVNETLSDPFLPAPSKEATAYSGIRVAATIPLETTFTI